MSKAIRKGQEMKRLRNATGINQKMAATMLGVSNGYLSLVECGKRNPSAKLERSMRRLYAEWEGVLIKPIGCDIVSIVNTFFEGSQFCVVCPDGDNLPQDCVSNCYPFNAEFCKLHQQCPCARLADERRLNAFNKWVEGRMKRVQLIQTDSLARSYQ